MPDSVSWRSNSALVGRLYVAIGHNLEHELQRRLLSGTLILEDHASRSSGRVVSRLQVMAALTGRADLDAGRNRVEIAAWPGP